MPVDDCGHAGDVDTKISSSHSIGDPHFKTLSTSEVPYSTGLPAGGVRISISDKANGLFLLSKSVQPDSETH